jgi:hypothetical protein
MTLETKPLSNVVELAHTRGSFSAGAPMNLLSFIRARTLSDTIIITIASKPSYPIISKTFDLLLRPFIESMKTRMLLRGIVSYGRYYISERLIIGPAIDDEAYHHDKLNWIGISLSPTLSIGEENITGDGIVYYENIPHKDWPYGSFVLNWPNSDSEGMLFYPTGRKHKSWYFNERKIR